MYSESFYTVSEVDFNLVYNNLTQAHELTEDWQIGYYCQKLKFFHYLAIIFLATLLEGLRTHKCM